MCKYTGLSNYIHFHVSEWKEGWRESASFLQLIWEWSLQTQLILVLVWIRLSLKSNAWKFNDDSCNLPNNCSNSLPRIFSWCSRASRMNNTSQCQDQEAKTNGHALFNFKVPMEGSLGKFELSFNNTFSINCCQFCGKRVYYFLTFGKLIKFHSSPFVIFS